jgi:hypothetical protein
MTTSTPDLPLTPVAQKYATAILSLVVLIGTALSAALSGPITPVVVWQLVALVLGGVGAFLVPLAPVRWQGVGKTGVAVLGAIVAAVIPLLTSEWTGQTILIVILAGVNALATELGVVIRTDTTAKHVAS